MKTYDWLVVGGGLTGAALSYELAIKGFSVLLIDAQPNISSATRYSYGGIPYWSGTTDLTTELAKAAIARYAQLSEELNCDIEFRNIDLLLTIPKGSDPKIVRSQYHQFAIQPQLLDVTAACELEPMLNSEAISGAIHYHHAHVNPELLVQAYQAGLVRHGGEIQIDEVVKVHEDGVDTLKSRYYAQNIVICAGGMGRLLLKNSGIAVKLYFTHAEVIETAPTDLTLRCIVMPAITERFMLEAEASSQDAAWNRENHQILPPSIDVGAVQFKNRQLKIGQVSQAQSNPHFCPDLHLGEIAVRSQVEKILPAIAPLSGTCHHCLVAFTSDSLPLIGEITDNIHIFSGFTSPFLFVPPLAQRFVESLSDESDRLAQLSPNRF
jgi:glycine/D-amino acid oxidase-like deaminating enzyme